MLWVFITCGVFTGASALLAWFGDAGPRRITAFVAVVVLLALAWIMGHAGVWGWLLMAGAVVVEGQRRFAIIKKHQRRAPTVDTRPPAIETKPPAEADIRDEATPSEAPSEMPVVFPDEQVATNTSPQPPPPFESVVLLSESRRPAGHIFVASLRRGGERHAQMDEGGDESRLSVAFGPIRMTLAVQTLPTAELNAAASQSWDWADAAGAIRACSCGVRVTTHVAEFAGETSRERIVRLHCRAHAALAEFLPVIGVNWPSAGRLTSIGAIQAAIDTADSFELARATCLNFRTFELDGDDAGMFLCDTLGLTAFGLRDAELITRREPDESVSAILYHIAGEMFRRGAVPDDDSTVELDDANRWQVTHGQSHIAPHREVCRLESPQEAEEDEAPPQTV